MQQSVVVQHQEGSDWALVLVATRSDYGRRSIMPMIFANSGCGVFAVAPQLKAWMHSGLISLYDPPPERREELLANAVQESVRHISLRSFIAERSKVGIIARAKACREDFNHPPEGFELNRATEPVFFWLAEKSENAVQAMRVLRYLINKNKIGTLTQSELEKLGERLLTRGESLKNVFTRR
jgi:hypothetical protein